MMHASVLYAMALLALGQGDDSTSVPRDYPALLEVRPGYDVQKVNTIAHEDVPWVSRDGQHLYFVYSPFDVWQLERNKAFDPKRIWQYCFGPCRPGTTYEDHLKAIFINFVSTRQPDGSWGAPERVPFDDESFLRASLSITADGQRMYSIRAGRNLDLLEWTRSEEGVWSNARPLPADINTEYQEDDPEIRGDGTILYWDSDRPGHSTTPGARDIWFATRATDGAWSKAQNVGPPVSSEHHEQYPFPSDDGKRLYFNRIIFRGNGGEKAGVKLMVAEQGPDGTWNAPEEIDLGMDAISISMPADESFMVLETGSFERGTDLWISEKHPATGWMPPRRID